MEEKRVSRDLNYSASLTRILKWLYLSIFSYLSYYTLSLWNYLIYKHKSSLTASSHVQRATTSSLCNPIVSPHNAWIFCGISFLGSFWL